MVQPKYSPEEALRRARLLMNYDSSKTLTENINEQTVAAPSYTSTVTGGGQISPTNVGGAGRVSGVVGSLFSTGGWPAVKAFIASPAAAGLGVVAVVGTALYFAYREATNKDVLAKTVEACNVGAQALGGKQKLIKDSNLSEADHIDIASKIFQGIENTDSVFAFLQGLGTDEEMIGKAFERLSKGNVSDVCGVIFEYPGADIVEDLAEDLNEGDLTKYVITPLKVAMSAYAGSGKIYPENSYSTKWYRDKFSCLFKLIDTVVTDSLGIDDNGYTFIKVKGLKRNSGDRVIYRLRGDDGVLFSEDGSKKSNATLSCDGTKVNVITESRITKNILVEQGIDDRNIRFIDTTLDIDDSKWAEGKIEATWEQWLVKFPCLKKMFPNAVPKKDDQGFTYFENKQPSNKVIFRMYSDGEIWTDTGDNTNKRWSCAPRGGKIIIESLSKKKLYEQLQIDPDTGGGTQTPTQGETQTPTPTQGDTPPRPNKVYDLESGSYTTPGDPYQYRVKNGQWETKSWKRARIMIDDWKSLKDNDAATKELDRRHPGARAGGGGTTTTDFEITGTAVEIDPNDN